MWWETLTNNSLLLLALGAVGWLIQTSITAKRKYEESVWDKRLETYKKILEPFVLIMSSAMHGLSEKEKQQRQKKGLETILSLDYRKSAFELTFIGSDTMVETFNNLWQHFYTSDELHNADHRKTLELLGEFLLAIRKDSGNRATKLENVDMLKWMITDIQKWTLSETVGGIDRK